MNSSPNQPSYPSFSAAPVQRPPSLWRRFRAKSRRFQWGIGCATVFFVLVAFGLCGTIMNAVSDPVQTASFSTPTTTRQFIATALSPTVPAIMTPTATPQTSHYPPKTKADLRTLAAQGDASAIHEFHSESVGLTGACPQPKRLVTVDPGITGKQLAEDLLAYFYHNQLDSPCGSIVFAYHTQAEANGDGYTAGRINFDATDSSGNENTDPNATNLKYTLTLDTGDISTGQEYVVSY